MRFENLLFGEMRNRVNRRSWPQCSWDEISAEVEVVSSPMPLVLRLCQYFLLFFHSYHFHLFLSSYMTSISALFLYHLFLSQLVIIYLFFLHLILLMLVKAISLEQFPVIFRVIFNYHTSLRFCRGAGLTLYCFYLFFIFPHLFDLALQEHLMHRLLLLLNLDSFSIGQQKQSGSNGDFKESDSFHHFFHSFIYNSIKTPH